MDQQPQATGEGEFASDAQPVERRKAARFPIEQEVRYRIFSRGNGNAGAGRTVNISSTGILFTTDQPVNPGERLEVSMHWPAQLDHKCPLKLVASGRVVRGENGTAAIVIHRYEFRTQGAHGLA
jgi:hypothetical protein